MKNDCRQCRHFSHDVERKPVCELLVGQLACQHCKAVSSFDAFKLINGSLKCQDCRKIQPMLFVDDWREGYLGNDESAPITPLPTCPGFKAIERPVEVPAVSKSKVVERSLF